MKSPADPGHRGKTMVLEPCKGPGIPGVDGLERGVVTNDQSIKQTRILATSINLYLATNLIKPYYVIGTESCCLIVFYEWCLIKLSTIHKTRSSINTRVL